jgi:hypothetical protein
MTREGKEVRKDARMGHGPEGGAWIKEFTGKGKGGE